MKMSHRQSRPQQLTLTLAFILTLFASQTIQADLAVIVHPKSPVKQLSARQVSKIFLGRLRLYPGTHMDIDVVDQNGESALFEKFYSNVVHLNPTKLKRYRASYLFTGQGSLPTSFDDGQAIKSYIAKKPNAIGYIDTTEVDESVKVVFSIPEN